MATGAYRASVGAGRKHAVRSHLFRNEESTLSPAAGIADSLAALPPSAQQTDVPGSLAPSLRPTESAKIRSTRPQQNRQTRQHQLRRQAKQHQRAIAHVYGTRAPSSLECNAPAPRANGLARVRCSDASSRANLACTSSVFKKLGPCPGTTIASVHNAIVLNFG